MSLLASFMLLQAAAAPAPEPFPLGTLPRQTLPARGCAAYLFTMGDAPALVAVASADPAQLRLAIRGAITDLTRAGGNGIEAEGFAASTDYRSAGISAKLDLTVVMRAEIKDGATIPSATLRLDREGRDGVVIPLTGLIGCAPAAK